MSFVSTQPTSIQLTGNLYVPLFSSSPEDVSLSLSESGSYQVAKNIAVTSISLAISVSDSPSISLSSDVALTLRHEPKPLQFSVSADVTGGTGASLALSGSLIGSWPHPFGLKWMNFTAGSLSLTLSTDAAATNFAISGSARMALGDKTIEKASVQVRHGVSPLCVCVCV